MATNDKRQDFLQNLNYFHERSGLSLREAASDADVDFSYLALLLHARRHPSRDVVLALGFVYNLDRMEMDGLLLSAGYAPLGRSLRREFHQEKMEAA